ncbi:MAG: hypothetical protein EBV15_09000 [Bacteroidetes bacterium]|nr:hypothetical protein [Bacteroidota bacterium]
MFTNRMKFTFPILTALLVLSSCSGLKTVSQAGNYDDAYFTASDLKGRGFYAEGVATGEFNPASPQRSGSYGQTYADRMRHFGGSTLQPAHRPVAMMQPCNGFRVGMSPMFGMGFNPYMGYNPMMMGNPWMMGNSWGNPMMMGNPWNNPWMMGSMSWNSFNDPYWMYYNQMYNPYMYWGGGSFVPGAAAARLLPAISTAILHPEVPTGRLPATPSRVHSMVAGVHQTRFRALRVAGVKHLTVFT